MKRLISTTLALSLLGTTAVLAAPGPQGRPFDRQDDRGGHNDGDRDHNGGRDSRGGNNGWHRGERFQARGPVFQVRDYHRYHLRRPPHGYHWVRYGNDYLLVAVASGIIADILINHY